MQLPERMINRYTASELQLFISEIQKDLIELNAMRAMLLIAKKLDAAVSGLQMGDNFGPGRDYFLKQITANVVMLRTIENT